MRSSLVEVHYMYLSQGSSEKAVVGELESCEKVCDRWCLLWPPGGEALTGRLTVEGDVDVELWCCGCWAEELLLVL